MSYAGFRFRFYPTREQERFLASTFGCVRFVYNWALALREAAFKETGTGMGLAEMGRRLTLLKKEPDYKWLQDVSSVPLGQSLWHLEKAYALFFRGVSRRPCFKSRRGRQVAHFRPNAFTYKCRTLHLAKMRGALRVVWTRKLPSEPLNVTVVREPDGRYFVSFEVEIQPVHLAKTKRSVGVDLGLLDVAALSDGWKSGNPKHLRTEEKKLARAQRALDRKQKGSRNREKQRCRVARIHARIRNQRTDFLHHLSTRLVRRYDLIACESLAVKSMARHPTLAKAIHDAGWGTLLQMLTYKCQWYGKTLVRVDRWLPSTKTCSACGHVAESLPLSVRRWTCPSCRAEHDRDTNAARNILAVGLTVSACGDGVSPPLALVSGAPVGEAGSPRGRAKERMGRKVG